MRGSRLMTPKEMGGMELKDLITFNKAILIKKEGRLHEEQDALWARVMKGVYYPRGNLMEAKKGQGHHGHGRASSLREIYLKNMVCGAWARGIELECSRTHGYLD